MARRKKGDKENILLNQDGNNVIAKKRKFHIWDRSLLLKQTLVAAWKSKLQLVILLLLTAFATSLVTGSWIAYQRIVEGKEFLQLDDADFDAVLPTNYYHRSQPVGQIANQAFSLKIGRLYYQPEDSDTSVAVYFDNTIIGQEIKLLNPSDLTIAYTRDLNGRIDGITDFRWTNPSHPLEFNLENANVRASLYGQLMLKADETNNATLKRNYLNAAQELYTNLFINITAGQILASLETYFTEWIKVNSADEILLQSEVEFTNFLVTSKINYRGSSYPERDLRIPNDVNLANQTELADLKKRLMKKDEVNPRLTPSDSDDYGMNGQWMTIYRNFDADETNPDIISDFDKQYTSPSNFNMVTDDEDPNVFSIFFASAAAALQNRHVNVVNQYVTTSGVTDNGKATSVKVVDLGFSRIHNKINLKIFEGIQPTSRNELAISPQYARAYGIRPGQTINISNRNFIVAGIGGDAYNVYPTLNDLDPIPNTRNEYIVYVASDSFYSNAWVAAKDKTDTSVMYFTPWKNVPVEKFDTAYFNDYYQRTIFADNKLNDRNQYDYDQYLIEKYIKNNPDYPTKYQLGLNLVVPEGDSQFSVYTKGRTMLSTVLVGFRYMAYAGVIFLLLIVIFITYLIIRKAIQKGQVSMGILKSAGYSTWNIIASYLAYPLVVLVIGIPVGWFVGLAIQVYFTEIFNTLFVLPYNVLNFNFIPLLISIALICGFVLITTLITGYKMLQKEPLALMKRDSDIAVGSSNKVGWLQERFKNRFKARFLLSLAKTSWKKIAVTSVVIAIATLAITTTVSVPATINNMKENYFKTQKYNNYYQYQMPIPNMPLSKYGLYAWNNLNNVNNEKYYPVAAEMPWAEQIVISDNNGKNLAWYNPIEYKKNSDDTTNFADILLPMQGVDPATINQIIEQVGKHLADQYNGPLGMDYLTWSYSWMGGRMFSNALIKDLSELDQSPDKNFSSSLITFATAFLPSVLGVSNPGVPASPDAIVEILKQTLPGFMRQVLDRKGPDAYDYFGIGHNSIAYNPNYNSAVNGPEEELVTQFQLGSTNSNLVNKGFLDVEGINPDTNMLVMKSGLAGRLRYNTSANVVPMVINRSFAAKYNLAVGSEFNAHPKVKTLYYLDNTNKLKPIPKSNWYYGKNPVDNDSGGIWDKSANKWNYRGEQKIGNTDFQDAFGYRYDGLYDQDGKQKISRYANSTSDINQVWLKLPEDITSNARSGNLRTADASDTLAFNVTNIASAGDANWIKPFSFRVTDRYKEGEIDPTNLLITRIPEWYGAMLDKGYLVVDDNLHSASMAQDIENNMPEWWDKIVGSKPVTRYHIIGIQDSYDTAKAYIDQKWANLIAGYSYYNDYSYEKDPLYAPGLYQWFSGKLSAADDIYDIVARMPFKRVGDDYSIYSMTSLGGNAEVPTVANSDLLLRKKEMLTKMTEISLSASLLFIVTTIICSILIVIMITDSFTDQFRVFMSHMKAEGYTNWEINSFTLGIFTPWAFLGYVLGYGLGFLTVFGLVQVMMRIAGLAFPFAFIWWIIPLSFGIIALIYFSTYMLNNRELNRMDLIALLKSDE